MVDETEIIEEEKIVEEEKIIVDNEAQKAVIILAIIEAILRYGPMAIIAIADAFRVGEPTAEDIQKLFITKKSEEYFK